MSQAYFRSQWEEAVLGSELKPRKRLFLLALLFHADDTGRGFFPGIESFAQKIRTTPRTANRHLKELEEMGLVSWTTDKNFYFISYSKLSQPQLKLDAIRKRTQNWRGTPPFGQKVQDGKLVPDDAEQSVIELIRRHRKSGKNYRTIANYLNAHGYSAKRGGQWTSLQVRRVCDRLKTKA